MNMDDSIVRGIEISPEVFTFDREFCVNPQSALDFIMEVRRGINPYSPDYIHEIKIRPNISLLFPGRKDCLYRGDYRLVWKHKVPKHSDICEILIKRINESGKDITKKYKCWIEYLEDIYQNGTVNADRIQEQDEKELFIVIFWITLQEEINKKDHLGRLRSLCRYAEALSTTQMGCAHTYEEVKRRMEVTSPEFLERWELPIMPSFYCWSAF